MRATDYDSKAAVIGPERRRVGPSPVAERIMGALREVPLFAALDETTVARLAAGATEVSLPAGAVLFREGDRAEAVFVVRTGRIQLHKRSDADDVMAVVGAPEMLG